jgi:tetratricopeptide (TPR) repeat protein
MYVDVIDNFEVLIKLKANWDAVYDADPEAQFFLSWTWIANWLENIDCQWIVLAAKETPDSQYNSFFPLQSHTRIREDGSFYNELRVGGADFASYTGFICMAEFQDRAIKAFSDSIKARHWTTLYLDMIRASEGRLRPFLDAFPETEFITQKIIRAEEGDDTDYGIYPYIDLPRDWETYCANNLTANSRQKAKRLLKMVDEATELRISRADANTVQRDMQILLRFWETRWAAKKPKRVLSNAVLNYRNMLMRCFREEALFLLVLWKGDTPIAARAALLDRKKRTLICFVIARDFSVKKPPPGFVLNAYSIRWAIENGFKTFDLLQGNHSYKYEFGPKERHIESIWISTSNRQNLGNKLEKESLPVALELARSRQKAGALEEAKFGCKQILETYPDYAGAQLLLEEIESSQPAAPPADFAKAFDFHQRGQIDNAEPIYRSLLAQNPGHFDATHLLGVIFLQRRQFAAAEQQIARAISLNPDFADAHNNRGAALNSLGRFDEALASFDRAMALRPDYPEAANNRGNALKGLGRPDEALACYDKAIALKTDYPDALRNRRNLLAELKRD